MESYGTQFDLNIVKAELIFMYNMSNFQGKRISDLLTFLRRTGLADSMTELYALTSRTSTIPVSTASVERSFLSLKQIKTYARSTTGPIRLSSLASISIEKELLNQLKQEGQLQEYVIECFLKKDRCMDFIYK